jgi:glyoxylase-like metal-dependent hydrolase (beta-lactamase superfamily II)
MVIGGGMGWIAPSLERQFPAMDFDLKRIKYLVISHSHFDHCGAVPYLKRKFPQAQIVASAYAKEVFFKEKAIKFIADTNMKMIQKLGLQADYERLNLQFNGIQVDHVVAEGDVIDLGDGIEAHFMEVPGHTRCSIAVYVPELKALFPSDAAVLPTDTGRELSYPSAQYDFPLYMESLKKLLAYEVEVCGFEHHGAFVGSQARNILRQGLEQAERFKDYVIKQYGETGDLDEMAWRLAFEAKEKNKFDFLNLELQTAVIKKVISNIIG